MIVHNENSGNTYQIYVELPSNSSDTSDEKEKHANEHNSGQPPGEFMKDTSTKALPKTLVIVLAFITIILMLVLACLLVNADGFNNFVSILMEVLKVLNQ